MGGQNAEYASVESRKLIVINYKGWGGVLAWKYIANRICLTCDVKEFTAVKDSSKVQRSWRSNKRAAIEFGRIVLRKSFSDDAAKAMPCNIDVL